MKMKNGMADLVNVDIMISDNNQRAMLIVEITGDIKGTTPLSMLTPPLPPYFLVFFFLPVHY